MYKHHGYCPACGCETVFAMQGPWLRDQYVCTKCGSIPRERALMHVLGMIRPNWRSLRIHESSPVMRGTSERLAKECPAYLGTQFFPGVPRGTVQNGWTCEDLEALTFADESIDVHVTQDVFEHIPRPVLAFREIARTLAPGGVHVFTTPLVNKDAPSEACIRIGEHGELEHLREPEYHGNPVSDKGSLVTMRWGFDIAERIHQACGLFTTIFHLDAHELGIHADYIEVMATHKPAKVGVVRPPAVRSAVRPKAVIFGAGRGGQNAFRHLGKQWEIVGFVDSDPAKQGQTLLDQPILAPESLRGRNDVVVLLASVFATEMQAQLQQLGLPRDHIKVVPGGMLTMSPEE